MRIKLKIRQKITLFILTTATLLYVLTIGYIAVSSRQAMLDDAFENAQLIARSSANKIEKEFERELSLTRTLASAFSIYRELPTDTWQDLFLRMYRPILEQNKQIYSLWDSWELYGYVPNYDKTYGRFCNTVWREGSTIKGNFEYRSMTGDPALYAEIKALNIEQYIDPYLDEGLFDEKSERLMMTSILAPIRIDGEYVGSVGLDISLQDLQKTVAQISPVEGSFAFLVSSNSVIAGHRDASFINLPLESIIPVEYERENLADVIAKGREHSFIRTDSLGHKSYLTFAPIHAGESPFYWSLAVCIPLDQITEKADQTILISLRVGIIGLLFLTIIMILIANNVTRPIRFITKSLNRLSKGEISDDLILDIRTGDEIETMAKSLNISLQGLNTKRVFANKIGEGELDSYLDLLGGQDVLGKSLINMRDSLRKAQEEGENRTIEDNKRTWANEGFALFADILRQNNDNLERLTEVVLNSIMKYVDGNQGILYLLKEDNREPYLEAVATYAWNSTLHNNQKVKMGEGHIGACALERETIFLTEIPDNFITISSGLGEANPNCIAIVPLKQDEKILGVLQIASFKILDAVEIDFLEKVSESIAATISTARINATTRILLEQSQQQAEEMLTQEEEMRQNMEELMATQEEMSRKEKEMSWTMDAVSGLGLLMEYDFKGKIINTNNLISNKFRYSKEELIGQNFNMLLNHDDCLNIDAYQGFWDKMNSGVPVEMNLTKASKINEIYSVKTYCHPVFDEDGQPLKIVEIGFDISEFCDKQ